MKFSVDHCATYRPISFSFIQQVVGFIFLLLGTILLFDRALLALGDLLFLTGIVFTIGLRRTAVFFFKKNKVKCGRLTLTPTVGIEPMSGAGRVRVRKITLSCWNASRVCLMDGHTVFGVAYSPYLSHDGNQLK